MKKLFAFLAGVMLVVSLFGMKVADAAVRVRGYTRSNGTYVQPYYRTSPNRTKVDNYGSYGNYNPYTGKHGTKHY